MAFLQLQILPKELFVVGTGGVGQPGVKPELWRHALAVQHAITFDDEHWESMPAAATRRRRPAPFSPRSSLGALTNGHWKTSCRYLVKWNGIRCPRWRASDDGPRPVYKYMGCFFSCRSRILSRSRCEKKMPRCGARDAVTSVWPITPARVPTVPE
eukprot:scaffold9221_cov118-Isochrysis_galbana.AAC.3